MALPSQSARSRNPSYGPRFTVSRKRPRRGRARLVLAIVILFAGLAAIYVWQWGGEEGPVEALASGTNETETDAGTDAGENPAPTRRPLSASNAGDSGNSGTGAAGLVMGQPNGSAGDAGGTNPSRPGATDPDPLRQPERPADSGRESTPVTTTPPPAPVTPRENTSGRDGQVQSLISSGDDLLRQGRIIQARDAYNRALHHPRASASDRSLLRTKLGDIGKEVTFSKRVVPGDEMAYEYTFKSGEFLGPVVSREGLNVEWQLIARVNGVTPNRIRSGQTLKFLRGPFHAEITKADYRLDVYSDFRDSGGNRIYVGSYSVGLGEYDSTPAGSWIVETTKLENPAWTNPRTGERFDANDPKNPIGERWIPLRGTDPNTENEQGIGIHGTIEPQSIGGQQSMGCVRLLESDVEWIYDLMTPRQSTVIIRP